MPTVAVGAPLFLRLYTYFLQPHFITCHVPCVIAALPRGMLWFPPLPEPPLPFYPLPQHARAPTETLSTTHPTT